MRVVDLWREEIKIKQELEFFNKMKFETWDMTMRGSPHGAKHGL